MASKLKWARVETKPDQVSWQHMLEGQPVRVGDTLQLCRPDGSRAVGRFRWSGNAAESPVLEVVVDGRSGVIDLPANALLEWPAAA